MSGRSKINKVLSSMHSSVGRTVNKGSSDSAKNLKKLNMGSEIKEGLKVVWGLCVFG